ncbi:hypothetical protein RI065_04350 [Mycoplasmatota bacterium zrk1]
MKKLIKFCFFFIVVIIMSSCSKETNHLIMGEIITVNEDSYYFLQYARPVRLLKVNITDDTNDEIFNHNVIGYGTFLMFDVLEEPNSSDELTATKVYSTHESKTLLKEMRMTEEIDGYLMLRLLEDRDSSKHDVRVKCNSRMYNWNFGEYTDFEFGDIIVTEGGIVQAGNIGGEVLLKFKVPISDQITREFPDSDNIMFLGSWGTNQIPFYFVESEYCEPPYNYVVVEKIEDQGFSFKETLNCPNKYYAIYNGEMITVFEGLKMEAIKLADLVFLDKYNYKYGFRAEWRDIVRGKVTEMSEDGFLLASEADNISGFVWVTIKDETHFDLGVDNILQVGNYVEFLVYINSKKPLEVTATVFTANEVPD